MSISVPPELEKYVVLTPLEDRIDRFKCPVPGCGYTTRLGPGALRMHILLRSDPSVLSRYDQQHEEYFKQNIGLDKEQVKILGDYPRKELAT